MSRRTWLITGCSTGIGRAIAEKVLSLGDNVAVTARDPSSIADIVGRYPDNAISLALDVADAAQVKASVDAALTKFGTIDVLVNNAGYGYVSSIEEGDIDAVKAMFDVNLFGALRMIQAVLPNMRSRRKGAILNIGSLAGRIANPATGFYSSSKFAFEALSEALSREVEDLGIRVCSIAPGMFRTDFSGRSLHTGDKSVGDYKDGVHERMALVQSVDGKQTGDPNKLAELVIAIANMDNPPRQMIAGPDAFAAISARMDEIRAAMDANRELSIATNLE